MRWTSPGRITDPVPIEPPDAHDALALHALVEEHLRRTGSPKAKALLGRWAESVGLFGKVMPEELRKGLAAQRARTEGSAAVEARA